MEGISTTTTTAGEVPAYGRVPVFPPTERSGTRNRRHRRPKNTPGTAAAQENTEASAVSNSLIMPADLPELQNRSTNNRDRRGNNRGADRGSRREGRTHNVNVEEAVNEPKPTTSRGRGGNQSRGQNRRGRPNQGVKTHPEQSPSGNIPPLIHTFNPEASPFVPHTDPSVRLVNLMDNPILAHRGRGALSNRRNNRPPRRANQNLSVTKEERRPKRVENPNAPLRERLKNQLEDNDYECMICVQPITARQGIWSCRKCYSMFHITGGCIVNWARKSRQEGTDDWSCPTCNTQYHQIPYNYYCFCGKDRNPPVQIGETPHSCGQVCGGSRGPGCPHPCSEPCHPGSCAECPVMVTQKCNCGKMEKTTRCGAGLQISCDKVCDRLLSCENHYCTLVCHSGDCAPCEEKVVQKCFCGEHEKEVPCHTGKIYDYSCGKPCTGKYSCGIHQCNNRCHPTGENCGTCVSAPERVSHCPCGKYSLAELGQKGVRTSCSDPVPTCESVCNKVLRCGSAELPHRCKSKCHVGPCPPCDDRTSVICRCEQVKNTVPCSEYLEILENGEFLCERRCKKKKTCGIHRCQEVCCVQDVHLCMQICNKRLSCGLHNCEYLCHPGECMRCLQASFDEQFCHCGRTMRPPPIPCGTPLPDCDEPCARQHACNHPVIHKCHSGPVCPPCTFLTEKECYGKHEIRRNIPCHIEQISCGRECGKELNCGVHTCTRRCHFGDCLKPGESCAQPCSLARQGCEHPCNVPCHGTAECPETPCHYLVTAQCECGRRKESMRCVEVEKIKQRMRAVAAENEIEAGEATEKTLKRTRSMENLACLPCSDECKKVARNKKIAEALSIVTNDDGDTDSPMITFTDTMKSGLKEYPQLVLELENCFTKMIEFLDSQTNSSNVATYNFKPMSIDKRRLIHEYAPYFQLESVSVDEVPKRSVIVTGRRGIARAPLILLSELNKYPSVLKAAGSTTLRHNINDEIKKVASEEESGMKQLKANRTAYKRMAPKVFVPEPVKQANTFAVLGSDDEDEQPRTVRTPPALEQPVGFNPEERDVNWWSDEEKEEEEEEEKPETADEPTKTKEIDQKLEELNIPENLKDSWSDAE